MGVSLCLLTLILTTISLDKRINYPLIWRCLSYYKDSHLKAIHKGSLDEIPGQARDEGKGGAAGISVLARDEGVL